MSLKDAFAAVMVEPTPAFEQWIANLPAEDREALIEAAPLRGISHRAFHEVVKSQGARVSKETITNWRKANGFSS